MRKNKLIVKIKRNSVLQHDSSDCGAACLVSIIRYYGGSASIENVRNLSGTTICGTSMLGLYQAAGKYGLNATGYEGTVQDIAGYDGVFVLHVTKDLGTEHYIILYGQEKGKFIIWDPAQGIRYLTREELEDLWRSKKCLGLIPNTSFIKSGKYIKNIKTWLMGIIKPDNNLLITSIFMGIAISVLSLVMAVFSQKLLDKILPSKKIDLLITSLLLVFILLLAKLIINSLRQKILLYQGRSFNIRIVENFFGSILALPKTFFDTRKTGDFVGRLNDTMRIQRVITDIVSIYMIDLLIMATTIIAQFFYSLASAFFTLFSIPVFFIIIYKWNNRILSAQHKVMSNYALTESNYINSIQGITEIKCRNWQGSYSKRNNTIYSEFQNSFVQLGELRVQLSLLTGVIGTIYLMIVLTHSSILVVKDKMTPGELLAILSISSTILPSILNLALLSIPVSEMKVAVDRMFEFTRINPECNSDESASPAVIERLKAEDITFRFPGQKVLLDGISLLIEKGKIVSLIGESGCGKSTLAHLLMRFYRQESGKIIINDSFDSVDFNSDTWRYSVSLIPQEIHIFNGTILENIVGDVTKGKITNLMHTLDEIGLRKFIESFPAGLMTVVGEEGLKLSGGQKQLIAFIRVLVKKPDILIVDEGTSGMDRETEGMIMNLLNQLKASMGILLITHRINILKKLSDYIYILEGKKITDHGKHDDLIKYDNLYKRYRDDFE